MTTFRAPIAKNVFKVLRIDPSSVKNECLAENLLYVGCSMPAASEALRQRTVPALATPVDGVVKVCVLEAAREIHAIYNGFRKTPTAASVHGNAITVHYYAEIVAKQEQWLVSTSQFLSPASVAARGLDANTPFVASLVHFSAFGSHSSAILAAWEAQHDKTRAQ